MPRGIPGSKAPHGTLTRLTTHRCRCRLCKDAMNEWRHRTGRNKPRTEYLSGIEPAHGSAARYNSKKWRCRCEACRLAANAERNRHRHSNGSSPAAVHGKHSTYSNGCRCDECRQANTDYSRERYRARKASA